MKKIISLILALTMLTSFSTFFAFNTAAATNVFDWDDISDTNTVRFYADSRVSTYTSKRLTTRSGSIYKGDLVEILNVYYDEVALVEYPTSKGYKTAYVALDSIFEKNSDDWSAFTVDKKTKVYRADDLKKSFGSVYTDDICFLISSDSDTARVIYPVNKGYKVGYIDKDIIDFSDKLDDSNSSDLLYDVPHYMQSDSRWKNVILNPEAKKQTTIGKAGCTTTASAMLVSWYYQDDITPIDIVNTADYTHDNLLMWDSLSVDVSLKTYNKTMTSSIRRDLLKLLQDGPVIIGAAKDSSGAKQHWCIVIGFVGDDINNPRNSDFIVLDPASSKVRTLNDFLEGRTYVKRLVYIK